MRVPIVKTPSVRLKRSPLYVRKGEFREQDHPRAADGRFGSGGGGGSDPALKPESKLPGGDKPKRTPREEHEDEVARIDTEYAAAVEKYEEAHAAWKQACAKVDSDYEAAAEAWAKRGDARQERINAIDDIEAAVTVSTEPWKAPGTNPDAKIEAAQFKAAVEEYAGAWAANYGEGGTLERRLKATGVVEDADLEKIRSTAARGSAAVAKAVEKHHKLLDAVYEAREKLDAAEAIELPAEPVEPDDAGYLSDDPDAVAAYEKEYAAYEKAQEKYDTAVERRDSRIEFAQEKYDTLTQRFSEAQEAVELTFADHEEKVSAELERVKSKVTKALEKEDKADVEPPPPKESDYPEEPEPPEDVDYPDEPEEEEPDEDKSLRRARTKLLRSSVRRKNFREQDHPRAADGKFGSGGGSAKPPRNRNARKRENRVRRQSKPAPTLAGNPQTLGKPTFRQRLAKTVALVGKATWNGLVGEIKRHGTDVVHVEHAVSKFVKSGAEERIAKLPKKVRGPVAAAWFAVRLAGETAMASFTVGQELSRKVALERGASPEQAERLSNRLAGWDVGLAKPAVLAAEMVEKQLGTHSGAGLVVGFVPLASLGYLATSLVRDPDAVARAAHDLVGSRMLKSGKARTKAARDVSDELRDESGKWTTGGGSRGTAVAENLDNETSVRAAVASAAAWAKSLDRDEKDAIVDYTLDSSINDRLRSGSAAGRKDQEAIEYLDAALEKASLPHDTVLLRGIHRTGLEVGDTFEDDGYTSATPNDAIAEQFSGDDGSIIELHLPKGFPAAYIAKLSPSYASEGEFLLPRGIRFEVTEEKDGRYVVQATLSASAAEDDDDDEKRLRFITAKQLRYQIRNKGCWATVNKSAEASDPTEDVAAMLTAIQEHGSTGDPDRDDWFDALLSAGIDRHQNLARATAVAVGCVGHRPS